MGRRRRSTPARHGTCRPCSRNPNWSPAIRCCSTTSVTTQFPRRLRTGLLRNRTRPTPLHQARLSRKDKERRMGDEKDKGRKYTKTPAAEMSRPFVLKNVEIEYVDP